MAKKSKLGVASAIVVGAGAAALYAKKASENKQAKRQTKHRNETSTAIQNAVSMKKTAKVFITATATTKHLPVRKNRKVLTISMHTL